MKLENAHEATLREALEIKFTHREKTEAVNIVRVTLSSVCVQLMIPRFCIIHSHRQTEHA